MPLINLKKISLKGNLLLKESAIVSFTEYLMLGSLFLTNVFLNRYYNTSSLGDFTFSYTVAQIVIMGIGGALTPILRREILNDNQNSATIVSNLIQIRVFFSCVFVLIALLISFILPSDYKLISYFVIAMLFAKGFDLLNETFYTAYQSLQKFDSYALIKCLNAICNILVVFGIAFFEQSIIYIYVGIMFVSILFFIINFLYLNSFVQLSKIIFKDVGYNSLKNYFLIESWPLVVNSIFFQLSSRISVVFIYGISGKLVSGVFSAAIMAITVFTAFANAVSVVLFSHLTRLYKQSESEFFQFLKIQSLRLFALGILLYAVFYLTVPIQFLLLGQMPLYSKAIFTIAGIAIPFAIVSSVLGNVFVIMHQQKTGMYISFFILMLNCIFYYVIPTVFKVNGPSIAFLLSNVFIIVIFLLFLHNIFKKKINFPLT